MSCTWSVELVPLDQSPLAAAFQHMPEDVFARVCHRYNQLW